MERLYTDEPPPSTAEFAPAEALMERVLEDCPEHASATSILAKLRERRAAEENRLELPAAERAAAEETMPRG